MEMRLQIWNDVIDEPRIIELTNNPYQNKPYVYDPEGHTRLTLSNLSRKTPVILHVNHEARTKALRKYKPVTFYNWPETKD